MIVQCESCKKRFKVPDDKVTPKGIKVRCGKCGHTFRVFPAAAAEDDPFAALGLPLPPDTASADPFAGLGLGEPAVPARSPGPAPEPEDLFAGLASPQSASATAGFGEDPFDQPTRVVDNPLEVGMAGAPAITPPPLAMVGTPPPPGLPAATLGRIQPKSIAVPPPAPGPALAPPSVDPFGTFGDAGTAQSAAVEPAPDLFAELEKAQSGGASSPAPAPAEADPFGAFGSDDGVFGSEDGAEGHNPDPFGGTDTGNGAPAEAGFDRDPFGPPGGLDSSQEPPPAHEAAMAEGADPFAAPAPPPPRPVPLGRLTPSSSSPAAAPPVKEDTAKRLALGAARMSGTIVNIAVAAALLLGLVLVGNVYFHEGRFNFSAFSPSHLERLWASQPRVITEDLSNGLYDTPGGRSILFVRGKVKNLTARAGRVEVTAELFDGDQLIRPAAIYAGKAPSPEALADVASASDLKRLVEKLDAAAEDVPPGGTADFLVPFYEYPSDLSSLHLKVSASFPKPALRNGGTSAQQVSKPAAPVADAAGPTAGAEPAAKPRPDPPHSAAGRP